MEEVDDLFKNCIVHFCYFGNCFQHSEYERTILNFDCNRAQSNGVLLNTSVGVKHDNGIGIFNLFFFYPPKRFCVEISADCTKAGKT